MPTVTRVQGPSVQTQVVSQQMLGNVDVSSGARSVASGLSAVATQFNAQQVQFNQTEAEDTLIQFEKAKNNLLFNPESGYLNSQGKNAYDGAKDASSNLEKLRTQFESQLSNDDSRLLFSRAALQQTARTQNEINRHASSGLKAYESATMRARQENTLENASLYYNDPSQLAVQRELGRQSVIDSAETSGIGAEATNEALQTFDSQFASNVVAASLGQSASQGKAALDRYGSVLEGPKLVAAKAAVKGKFKQEKSQREAAFNKSESRRVASESVNIARTLSTNFDLRSEAIAEADKIKDPKLRKATMREVAFRFNQKKAAESEQRVASFEEAENFVLGGGSADEFKAANIDAWESMSPKQKRSIEKGEKINTDWNEYTRLVSLPDAELAKVDVSEYADSLAPSERSKLASAVVTARTGGNKKSKVDSQVGRTRASQTTSTIEQLVGKKKSKWGDDDVIKANTFYSLIDEEVDYRENEKGSNLTSSEFTTMVNDINRKLVIEGMFFDDELSLSDVPTERVNSYTELLRRNNATVSGVSLSVLDKTVNSLTDGDEPSQLLVDQVTQVISALQRQGKAITPDTVKRKYKQAIGN